MMTWMFDQLLPALDPRMGVLLASFSLASLAAAGLSGVEVDHPEQDAGTRSALRALAAELELLATGSSDYHGSRKPVLLGDFTTPRETLAALRSAASTPVTLRGAEIRPR